MIAAIYARKSTEQNGMAIAWIEHWENGDDRAQLLPVGMKWL